MPKYLFGYHGGGTPETPEEGERIMAAGNKWFEGLGPAVVDIGNPIGMSRTINGNGSVSDGGGVNPVTGYSLVEASDLDAAVAMAKGCPIFENGGSIQVGEALEM
ncbi:hypothetical protein [Devosia nitrariae]|uniref:YCII-related domain-containing protein n=1 Tax=Devosia nitrariae TaxID=2071872 RepID=A0ABQ5W516_9HYPH|nr:hypothetical protein [Devosia nitrariae]GLQ55077.1 hypothetical protein GCM10010862_23360 [Devosia nitrariae]